MAGRALTIADFERMVAENGIHTVELAAADTQGHLRGKRIPAPRFLGGVHRSGAHVADAMFVFDVANDLPDNEFINMDTGYLDCHLVPDNSTGRVLGHRPGYGIVFADAYDQHGDLHPLAPRTVLANQVERCRAVGIDPLMATEMEFYLCRDDWSPVQEHIQYSSLTDMPELEPVLHDMRTALLATGIDVESSNAEYGPGQIEINAGPADAMTAADNAALYKSIVKQVAIQHGLRATFMPKPWTEQSGSGMHLHTSLRVGGENAFADSETGEPNGLMRSWIAGLLTHAPALTLLGAPTSNGPKRIRPYTFCPTHVTWGLDNRTVLARCIRRDRLAGQPGRVPGRRVRRQPLPSPGRGPGRRPRRDRAGARSRVDGRGRPLHQSRRAHAAADRSGRRHRGLRWQRPRRHAG